MNHKTKIITAIGIVVFLAYIMFALSGITGTPEEQLAKMSPKEREYLDSISINKNSTVEDAIELLGEPAETTLGKKYVWWVKADNQTSSKQKLIIYFSDKKATELRFDGGPGKFYYTKDLKK